MTTEVRDDVTDRPIVRHYRAQTRSEVEQAYRSDALQAARAGYVSMSHTWSEDPSGFLLAVTFAQAAPVAPPAETATQSEEPAQPGALGMVESEPQPVAIREQSLPEPAVIPATDEQFAMPATERRDPFAPVPIDASAAPAAEGEFQPADPAGTQTLPPNPPTQAMPSEHADEPHRAPQPVVERYAPPPELYEQPPGMYVPVTPTRPEPEAEAEPEPQSYQPAPEAEPEAEPEPQSYQPAPEPEAEAEPEAEPEAEAEPQSYQPAPEPEAEAEPEAEPEPQSYQPAPEPEAEAEPEAEPEAEAEPQSSERPTGRRSRLVVQTMDLHAAGEPLRIIRSGFPDVPNLPVLERRKWVMQNADEIRRALMFEPRGHRDMYGAILLPPHSDSADMTVLFMHNEGYSTMCGHGIIAITTGLIEEGLFPATQPVTTIRYEVPAGVVAANAATLRLDDGTWAVRGVRFTNVPAYLAAQGLAVVPEGVKLHGTAAQYGALSVDLAFGGAYYGIVSAAELGLRVVPDQAEALRRAGAAITDVLRRDHTPSHPTDADLSFVYGTIIVDLDPRSAPDGRSPDAHIRNVTIFADAELDRSPCGSGTSAILAQLHARGRLAVGQEIVNAGITGEHFLGRVEAETALGPYRAVSTSIAGTAYLTGYSTFIVDSRDPLGDGFLLG